MNEEKNASQLGPMSIGKAWKKYAIALGVVTAIYFIGNRIDAFADILAPVFAVIYLACGVLLNRYVLRKLIDWHPVNRTIENQYRTKIYFFLFWPFRYPILFYKLSVIKHL